MTLSFIQHELKAFWRSKNTGKSIAVRIVMGVLILYLLLNVLVVGFFMDKVLEEVFPTEKPGRGVLGHHPLLLYVRPDDAFSATGAAYPTCTALPAPAC